MKINGVEFHVDVDKFIGRIKVRADGRVEVVTITKSGKETTSLFSWQEIKRAIEEAAKEAASE
jgi:hypothetical protein